MRILDFIVSGQKITRDPKCDFSGIASGSRGYLKARFRFSADWKGFKRVAVFSCRGKDYPTPILNSVCEIPAEALLGDTVGVRVIGRCGEIEIPTNRITFQQRGA